MFPVKHTVIYTCFALTSVQNTCFCSVFNALASKNPAKSCYVQCFFHFWPFFHCRKATKMTQNSISIPSWAQTPKNPRKMSKTPPNSGLGAKPFLGSGLGAKPFLGPPPAKADIATAILTNVIEHLVLLLPPNKHAFTAKAVWADFKCGSSSFSISKTACLSDPCTAVYTQRIPTYSSRFVRSILAARCDDLARIVKPRGRSRSIEVE